MISIFEFVQDEEAARIFLKKGEMGTVLVLPAKFDAELFMTRAAACFAILEKTEQK